MKPLLCALALMLAAPAFAADEAPTGVDAWLEAVSDPEQEAAHGAAWRSIAEQLEADDLPYAALLAWSRAVAADPQGLSDRIGPALELAERLHDEAALAAALGNDVGIEGLDAETRSKVALVAARYHLRRDSLGTAAAILLMVDPGSEVYPDAEALRGVVLAAQGRPNDALAPLLTAQGAARQRGKGDRFDDVMELNVARAYYAAGNWGQAAAWFAKVDRDSEYWPDAQFERAWAHFRGDDVQGALGLLKNHDSPFFDGWYYPEADLLRAYSLFTLCKFPSASAEIDAFVTTWTPVKEALDGTLGALSDADAFAEARLLRDGKPTRLPAMMLRGFRTDDRFGDAVASVDAIDAELKTLAGRSGPLAEAARGWLTERRDARIAEEGGRVIGRARKAQAELADMLQGIEITRIDLLALETEMYERAAATGELQYGDRVGKLRDMRKAKRGHRVWPFQGEYWADELGWYVVDARPDCPPGLTDGGPG